MGTPKKCYKCLMEVEQDAKACPRCKAKLGAMEKSGIAGKPGSPALKIFFAVIALAIACKIAGFPRSNNSTPLVQVSTGLGNIKDQAIQKIKAKGEGELSNVGVADVGYKDDTLCVYVNPRFDNLSKSQQEELLTIVAGDWEKAIGKTSTAVKIMEYGTGKTLQELVV